MKPIGLTEVIERLHSGARVYMTVSYTPTQWCFIQRTTWNTMRRLYMRLHRTIYDALNSVIYNGRLQGQVYLLSPEREEGVFLLCPRTEHNHMVMWKHSFPVIADEEHLLVYATPEAVKEFQGVVDVAGGCLDVFRVETTLHHTDHFVVAANPPAFRTTGGDER